MAKNIEFWINAPRYYKEAGQIKTFKDGYGNEFSVGFFKMHPLKYWRAVELYTGLKCCRKDHKTLKDCIAEVESLLPMFGNNISSKAELEPVKRFRNFVDIIEQFEVCDEACVELPRFCSLRVMRESDGEHAGSYRWRVIDYYGSIMDEFFTDDISEGTCYYQLCGIYDFVARNS